MREIKKITILVLLMATPWALMALVACGTTSDTGKVITESGSDTGELYEGEPCASGSNNHLNAGQCFCNEGHSWCNDNLTLDCCPE